MVFAYVYKKRNTRKWGIGFKLIISMQVLMWPFSPPSYSVHRQSMVGGYGDHSPDNLHAGADGGVRCVCVCARGGLL